MPDGWYNRDTLAWAEEQAGLLRRLAAGERVNNAIDWPNVIEEVQEAGQAQLRSCRSLWRQAMIHLLKLHAWPESGSAAAWRAEIGVFLDDAEGHYSASMRQLIDLEAVYARALLRAGQARDESGLGRAWPNLCPFTIEALLAGDVDGLLGLMASGSVADD